MLNALYGVLPLTEYVLTKAHITRFEQYLMAYMQIHTCLSNLIILLIFGRDSGQCSRLIHGAVGEIGRAGKTLSVLKVDPDYLELACLQ